MNDMQMLANIAGMTAELIESGKLVRVVRCKDCKKEALCRRHWDKDEDWYCADGERKDGDGNDRR